MGTLEIIGSILTLAGIYLAAQGKITAWPLQLIASVLYTWVFFTVHLFGEALLQLIYAFLSLYGWWMWLSDKKIATHFTVSYLTLKQWSMINLMGMAFTFLIAQFQFHFLPTDLPYLDSFILVFAFIAQWMQAVRKIENWLYWVLLDIIAAGIYWHKDLQLTAALYLALAVIAIRGWVQWHQHYHRT